MWTITKAYDNTGLIYSVGYEHGESFKGLLRCDKLADAMMLVNYLNGGTGEVINLLRVGKDGSNLPIREIPDQERVKVSFVNPIGLPEWSPTNPWEDDEDIIEEGEDDE